MDILIRNIQPADNKGLATIIRNALAEFGANKPGTVYYDETTDHLYEAFQIPLSRYFVAWEQPGSGHPGQREGQTNGAGQELLGGAGIYPTPGLPEDTCELVKMYLSTRARGAGLGKRMIEKCLEFARQAGYKRVYLETMPELQKAVHVYEKFGFRPLPGPMGNSGHFDCSIWMLKDL